MGGTIDEMHFKYPSVQFTRARSALMAPHPHGEEQSFVMSFEYCDLGLHRLQVEFIDNADALQWIDTIRKTLNTSDLRSRGFKGSLWLAKANKMSDEERFEFARAVDALAYWLDGRFWGYPVSLPTIDLSSGGGDGK